MSRILAIDYGKKRTGIAVTDILQIIANGLTTVPTPQLEGFILKYVQDEPVERIVVGHPRQMNYEESENMVRITPHNSFVVDVPRQYARQVHLEHTLR